MPERMQGGRADPAGHQFLVEPFQMLALRRRHCADRIGRRAVAQHGQLALINPLRAILAGVIDPQHPLGEFPAGRLAGQGASAS